MKTDRGNIACSAGTSTVTVSGWCLAICHAPFCNPFLLGIHDQLPISFDINLRR